MTDIEDLREDIKAKCEADQKRGGNVQSTIDDNVSWLPVSASKLSIANGMSKDNKTNRTESHAPLSGVVGSLFIYQKHVWKVKTEGKNGMFGVECQNYNRAFISMHIDEIMTLIEGN